MRNYIFTLFSIGVLTSWGLAAENFLSDDFINSLNEKQNSWKAGRNYHPDTPAEYLRRRNGALLDPNFDKAPKKIHKIDPAAIPYTFDGRTHWSQCDTIKNIRNQGACGDCWAFASVETMTDRLCIQTDGKVKFTFSPEDLLTCCSNCGDCDGGWYGNSFEYWTSQGVVSGGDYGSNEGCQPYEKSAYSDGDTPASCVTSCTNNNYPVSFSEDKHFGTDHYYVSTDVQQIQTEILTNGPIATHMVVYEDFYNYKSGVYVHTSGDKHGGHAVKIIGWGTENGTPYWLIANSWGTGWADLGGFFKILRGENHCEVELRPYGGNPKI